MAAAIYHFGVVVSDFNRAHTDALLRFARAGLKGHKTTVVRVPGAFEIPLQAQRLAQTGRYQAVLALGLIWQGETAHAGEIGRAVTDALMRIALETNVPVIHQVLSVKTEAEAKARTMGRELNRGTEAARAALALAALGKKATAYRPARRG